MLDWISANTRELAMVMFVIALLAERFRSEKRRVEIEQLKVCMKLLNERRIPS
jgi:hypothetical protein